MIELAATVVSLVLPYVKKGAEGLIKELKESAGDEAAKQGAGIAARVWERVKRAVSSNDDGKYAIQKFEREPDSEASQALLKEQLSKRLTEDPKLAEELGGMIRQEVSAGRDVVQLFGEGGIQNIQTMHGGTAIAYAGSVEKVEKPQPLPPTSPPGTAG